MLVFGSRTTAKVYRDRLQNVATGRDRACSTSARRLLRSSTQVDGREYDVDVAISACGCSVLSHAEPDAPPGRRCQARPARSMLPSRQPNRASEAGRGGGIRTHDADPPKIRRHLRKYLDSLALSDSWLSRMRRGSRKPLILQRQPLQALRCSSTDAAVSRRRARRSGSGGALRGSWSCGWLLCRPATGPPRTGSRPAATRARQSASTGNEPVRAHSRASRICRSSTFSDPAAVAKPLRG